MSGAAPLHTARRLIGGESLALSARYRRERARVRCLDSSSTRPSTRVTTGLMESNEPSRARAPPIRPPFSRCSRVSTTPYTRLRGMRSVTRSTSSSSVAPPEAISAVSSAIRPRPMVSERESTVRTGIRSPTALAAATAAWWVAETSEDRLMHRTPS